MHDTVCAATRLTEWDEAEVFTIGHDRTVTINELAAKIIEFTGSESRIAHVSDESMYGEGLGEMRRRTLDIRKIPEAIGFELRHDSDDILRDVIDYNRSGEEAPQPARPEAK